MSKLRVGAARVCIDPPLDQFPFPSNFGMCDELRNSCYVRVLALDNGKKKVLFVVYELSDKPDIPDLTEKMAAIWGIDREDVILTVTHNHSSPCHKSKMAAEAKEKLALYRQIELEKGLEAVEKAVASLRPAKWGYGEIQSHINVNRDLETSFGFWVEGPNYDDYSNHTLACLKFVDENDKPIAALLNFGCHAVCAFVQKDVDGKVKMSSNFPGIACRFVEEHFGDDCVVAWTSGAAGNQDPILFDYQWLEYPDGYVTKISLPDGSGYVHMDILGSKQGADAVTCLKGIEAKKDTMSITHLHSIVPVPAQMRDPNFKMPPFGLRMGGVGPRTDWNPPKMPDLPTMMPSDKTIDFTLNLLQLDDLAVLMTSGEIYAQIARDMMAAVETEHSFVMTHIPGQGGYTLDRSSLGHKTFQSFGGVKAGDADGPLRDKAVELVRQAKAMQ